MSALTDVFSAIAGAIRNKLGVATTYKPNEMATAIASIPSAPKTKTVVALPVTFSIAPNFFPKEMSEFYNIPVGAGGYVQACYGDLIKALKSSFDSYYAVRQSQNEFNINTDTRTDTYNITDMETFEVVLPEKYMIVSITISTRIRNSQYYIWIKSVGLPEPCSEGIPVALYSGNNYIPSTSKTVPANQTSVSFSQPSSANSSSDKTSIVISIDDIKYSFGSVTYSTSVQNFTKTISAKIYTF